MTDPNYSSDDEIDSFHRERDKKLLPFIESGSGRKKKKIVEVFPISVLSDDEEQDDPESTG
jgi:hypothetical protein